MINKKIVSALCAIAVLAAAAPVSAAAEVMGDIDGSGKVDSYDSLITLRYSVRLEDLSDEQIKLADIDTNQKIDSADALYILRMSVGLPAFGEQTGMIEESIDTLNLPYFDGTDRMVRVYVPAHEENETLPVIYMTDGQNLFDIQKMSFACWNTCEAVKEERKSTGKAAIIVGIHSANDPAARGNELLPKSMGRLAEEGGLRPEELEQSDPQGELFEDFVLNTVMPAVEKSYPVKTGRENTAFCGSSSGGLESFYIAMNNPDKFAAAGVFSPALMFYEKEDLENWVRTKAAAEGEKTFLYMYCGGRDPVEKQILGSFNDVTAVLNDCYPAEKLKVVEIPENVHNEASWAPIFKDLLHVFLIREDS